MNFKHGLEIGGFKQSIVVKFEPGLLHSLRIRDICSILDIGQVRGI